MEPKIPLPGPKSPLLETFELSSRFLYYFPFHTSSHTQEIFYYIAFLF